MQKFSFRSLAALMFLVGSCAFSVSYADSATVVIDTVNGRSFVSGMPMSNIGAITFQGRGPAGSSVVIGRTWINGMIEWNEQVDATWKWTLTTRSINFAAGTVYFSISGKWGDQPFTLVFPTTNVSAAPSKIQCSANGSLTETNANAEYGTVIECSVSTSDTLTKAKLNSGYTSWGDVDSTKIASPQIDTDLPVYCANGTCMTRFTADYHGYSSFRSVWFENSSGKSSAITITMQDHGSDDYKQAEAYLANKYKSGNTGSVSGSSTTSVPASSASTAPSSTTSTTVLNLPMRSGNISITSIIIDGHRSDYSGQDIVVPGGKSLEIIGKWTKNAIINLTRNDSPDFISSSANNIGEWSIFGLGTVYNNGVIKGGANTYALRDGGGSALEVRINFLSQTSGSNILTPSASAAKSASPSAASVSPMINTYTPLVWASASWITASAQNSSDLGLSASEQEKVDAFMSKVTAKMSTMNRFQSLVYLKRVEHKIRAAGIRERNTRGANYRAMHYLLPIFAELREKIVSK